jgi:hypothetical protein
MRRARQTKKIDSQSPNACCRGRGRGSGGRWRRCSGSEIALVARILSADFLQVVFRHDRFQAIGKVLEVTWMVNGGRGPHEIVHDRLSNRQNLLIGLRRQIHFTEDV